MKAIGYCRVSTEEQAREGISLDNQKDKIEAYATLKDLELIDIIVDSGLSAKNLQREGIQNTLVRLQNKEADALIIYKLDRLTRSTKDLLGLVYDIFIPQNIALLSITENLDTTCANGRFFLTMLGGIATWERETIAERTRDVMQRKKQLGEWIGRVPFGFTLSEDKRLCIDEERAKLIQKAKRLRRQGMSIRAIANRIQISKSLAHKIVLTHFQKQKSLYLA